MSCCIEEDLKVAIETINSLGKYNKSSEKSAHFLIDFYTIGLLFATNVVAPCWALERMQV